MLYIKTEKICKGYAVTQAQTTKVTEKNSKPFCFMTLILNPLEAYSFLQLFQ